MKVKLLLMALALSATTVTQAAGEHSDSTVVDQPKKIELPKFSNVKVRAMMRTEMRFEQMQGADAITNFRAKPAMLQLTGDLGKNISFAVRNRFDWPTTILSDGTPMSLIIANVSIKANDNLKFTLGKQMMMQGGWEFDYNPMEVFFYSMVGDNLQGFQTGASAHYTAGKQNFALQVTKVTDNNFALGNYKNAWNGTFFWGGDLFNGIYKPLWSYTITNASNSQFLHSVMIGNQFNIDRVRIEFDFMQHTAFRSYENDIRGSYQSNTTDRSYTTFVEYRLPGDRFLLGGKFSYDQRFLTKTNEEVTNQKTTSVQLRYRLFPQYGLSLHAAYAYRIENTPTKFNYLFNNKNSNMFYTGLIWDFTTK